MLCPYYRHLNNGLFHVIIMQNFTKITNIVIANKNQSVRATIPNEIVKLLAITTADKLKWTLDMKTEQIVLELIKD